MNPIIELHNLKKSYPRVRRYRDFFVNPFERTHVHALNGLDLTVRPAECFVLLGPNGAGKTTLIKILSTLVLPTEGRALVNGLDVQIQGREVRRTIGYILSDERSFYWRLTGRQNLNFFAVLNNLYGDLLKQRIEEIIERLDMGEEVDRMFKDYSTGMRQKLAIARGLLTDPSILFLDEPTRSLDPLSAERVRSLIQNKLVREWGKTVMMSTHNLMEAERLGDRVAILHRGRIRAMGSVTEISESLNIETKRYSLELGSVPDDLMDRIRSLPFVQESERDTNLMNPDSPDRTRIRLDIKTVEKEGGIEDVLRELLRFGVRLYACYPTESALTQLFRTLEDEDDHIDS